MPHPNRFLASFLILGLSALPACGGGSSVLPPSRHDLLFQDAEGVDAAAEAGDVDALRDAADIEDAGEEDGPGPGDVAQEAGEDPGFDPAAPDAPDTFEEGTFAEEGDTGEIAGEDLAADGEAPDDGTIGPDDADLSPDDATADEARDTGPVDGSDAPDASTGGFRIRFMAANLTSGGDQSYDLGHGIRLMAGARADVYLVQEFNYGQNAGDDYRAMADAVCGTGCAWSVGDGQIPNGVISRWPIVDHGAWDDPNISNRDLDWARIDLPGAKDLVAVSVHLHTSPSADQVEAAQVVVRKVAEHRAANPGCCWYVVGGDFNGTAAVSNNGFGEWNGEDVFHVSGPHPLGEDGSPETNRNRSEMYDFVLLDTALHAFQVPVVAQANDGGSSMTWPSGLVFDSRDFTQAQLDRYFPPALAGDSNASNMQHMGILKDVVLP